VSGIACFKPTAKHVSLRQPVLALTAVLIVTAEEGQPRNLRLVQKGTTLAGEVEARLRTK